MEEEESSIRVDDDALDHDKQLSTEQMIEKAEAKRRKLLGLLLKIEKKTIKGVKDQLDKEYILSQLKRIESAIQKLKKEDVQQ